MDMFRYGGNMALSCVIPLTIPGKTCADSSDAITHCAETGVEVTPAIHPMFSPRLLVSRARRLALGPRRGRCGEWCRSTVS